MKKLICELGGGRQSHVEEACLRPELAQPAEKQLLVALSEVTQLPILSSTHAKEAKDQNTRWLQEVFQESKLQRQQPCSMSSPGGDTPA